MLQERSRRTLTFKQRILLAAVNQIFRRFFLNSGIPTRSRPFTFFNVRLMAAGCRLLAKLLSTSRNLRLTCAVPGRDSRNPAQHV